jgi:hypothetical protein
MPNLKRWPCDSVLLAVRSKVTIPSFVLRDWRKPRRTSVRTVILWAENWVWDLLNINQEYFCLDHHIWYAPVPCAEELQYANYVILYNKMFSGYQPCQLVTSEKTNVSRTISVLVLRVLMTPIYTAGSPRTFYYTKLPWKLQVIYVIL